MAHHKKRKPLSRPGPSQREKEALYRAIFEASADGILVADLRTRKFIYANAAICRMFGYGREEMLRLGLKDIHLPKDLPVVMADFESRSRGEKTVASVPCLKKNGEVFQADINTASAVLSGRRCNIGIFRDISSRLRVEEALKRACADLAKDKRRLEEKNIALREAMYAVEAEKVRLKDDMVANVNETVMPILKRMRMANPRPSKHIELLEKTLGVLVSSFGRKITERELRLTPKEIEISNMVKAGMTTKEIADLMGTSVQTIDKHRNNIRRKLGLSKKGVNLASYLQSI